MLKTATPNRKKVIKSSWTKRILIILSVIICIPIGLFTVGWFNRDTLIEVVQEWYSKNSNGTLSIGDVKTSFFTGFPKIGFTIEDIEQTSIDSLTDKHTAISIEQVKISVNPKDLLRGDIKIEKISLTNAHVHSEVVPTRPFDYYRQLKIEKAKEVLEPLQLSELLHKNRLKFSLKNVNLVLKDTTANKHIDIDFHNFSGNYNGNTQYIEGDANLDATVNLLGFNMKKGAFFNGAQVSGRPHFEFNIQDHVIEVSKFPFDIAGQTFQLEASFGVGSLRSYDFRLNNAKTDLKLIKRLLPDSIAVKLEDYSIIKPFPTKLHLGGLFSFGNDPVVNASFFSKDNHVIISDTYHLKNADFHGNLTTDVYKNDSLGTLKASPKDLRLNIDNLDADLDGITVSIDSAYYMSTPGSLNFVNAKVELYGSNEALARLIDTDNFDFKGGSFILQADIVGDIPSVADIANHAKGDFSLSNTRVVVKRNGLQLSISSIRLHLDQELASLRQFTIAMPNGNDLNITGWLTKPAGLLLKDPISSTSSKIDLVSKDININEIIDMATEFLPKSKSKVANRKTLHETLDAVYSQFHPNFNIDVKSVRFDDIKMEEVKAQLDLVDAETIAISDFNFRYHEALTDVSGTVNVPQPKGELKDPIVVDLKVASKGSVQVFKNLFNIELLDIISGEFNFNGSVTGNVNRFNQLLNNAKGNLTLSNNHYFYEPADMVIMFDSLDLQVEDATIILDKFKLDLADLRPMTLNGRVNEFPNFLLEKDLNSGSIDLNISTPFLDGDNVLSIVSSLTETETDTLTKARKQLHTVFTDISHFDPSIAIHIDSLKYKDLITKDIKAQLFFENDSTLSLKQFNIGYKASQAQISGQLLAHEGLEGVVNSNPFEFNFVASAKGESRDLNDYLKTTNFIFNSGNFEFTGVYEGQSDNLKLINSDTKGQLKLGPSIVYNEAAQLRIPIDSLNVEIENDVAILKKLELNLPGRSSVDFSGSIDHFTSFINNTNKLDNQRSNFEINSSYLDTQDLKTFLSATKKSENDNLQNELNLLGFKKALNGINRSFKPTLNIAFDTLRHDNLELKKFGSRLFFDALGNFNVSDTSLEFYGGEAELNVEFGLGSEKRLPVDVEMKVQHININELLVGLNYFDDENLKNADKIEGMLDYELRAKGWVDNEGNLEMESLNGTFALNLSELAIYGYQPILDNVVLLKPERFEHLRFRPIIQTFEVIDGKIIIPRTEIQSSALHVFIEGELKLNEFVNIWVSIPWKNLKKNDGLKLPEKTTYDLAGSKFFIQLLQQNEIEQSKGKDLKIKLRLSNRKWRKRKVNSLKDTP